MLSGQQNQFCSGQQPAGHMVPSHCFLAAILTSFSFMVTNGQSAAVAAQYMLSGQQNQFCSGQQPAGHMVPSHCFLAAILTSFSFMLANGQSAAVAAQYMLSGQQNQSCSGQHPAGHIVPWHCSLFTNFWWPFATAKKAKQARTRRPLIVGQ